MKQLNIKKLVLLNLPYFLLGLFATNRGKPGGWRPARMRLPRCSHSSPPCRWRWGAGGPACTRWICWVGLCCGAGLRLAVYLKGKNAKKYRHNVEYGSARWGTHEDIAPYIDPVFQNNVILTQTERPYHVQPSQEPQVCPQQERSGHRRQRFRQDPLLAQAEF